VGWLGGAGARGPGRFGRIGLVSRERWTAVDAYLSEHLVEPDPVLDAALADSDRAGLPAIQVTALQGKLLQLLARATGARRILELGTLGGYSTIWLARALPPGGRLVTLEVDPRHAEVARANLARAGVADGVEIRLGPALETLPQLAAGDPFDLVFLDADKPAYPDYLPWLVRLCRPGGLIIADNVVRQGQVADPDNTEANVVGARRFTELLAADPRLSATTIQTVGAKGHDGFALAVVGPAPTG
jgi:predicted O-methyltransferase YrrM